MTKKLKPPFISKSDLLKLSDGSVVNLEDQPITFLTTFPIGDDFPHYALFFAYVGYMSHQIALIEEGLRSLMHDMADDFDNVNTLTKGKNLQALLNIFELAFLSKYSSDNQKKRWFFTVKKILVTANKFRNEAVHSEWEFINSDINQACYFDNSKKVHRVINLEKMKQRAAFTHLGFQIVNCLHSQCTMNPEFCDESVIISSKLSLDKLADEHA